MQDKQKRTASMYIHLYEPGMKAVDDIFIVLQDENYKVTFFIPKNHESSLKQFDLNRRQYDFYCIPLTRDECELLCRLLQKRRTKLASLQSQPEITAGKMPRKHQLLMIRLKDMGLTYSEIARQVHCSTDNVKQFFSRYARKLGVKGFHSLLKRLKIAGIL